MTPFADRQEAGRKLAERLRSFKIPREAVVLALPRGGLPVGFEVAQALGVELDVLLVRKLGVPGHEELAMGAIASGNVQFENEALIRSLGIDHEIVERVAAEQGAELSRRERLYRGDRAPIDVRGRTVILIDDGLATGASMRAAITSMKQLEPELLIVAVPTAPPETCQALMQEVDEVVCLATPKPFMAVGQSYGHFPQVTDDEVRRILDEARRLRAQAPAAGSGNKHGPQT